MSASAVDTVAIVAQHLTSFGVVCRHVDVVTAVHKHGTNVEAAIDMLLTQGDESDHMDMAGCSTSRPTSFLPAAAAASVITHRIARDVDDATMLSDDAIDMSDWGSVAEEDDGGEEDEEKENENENEKVDEEEGAGEWTIDSKVPLDGKMRQSTTTGSAATAAVASYSDTTSAMALHARRRFRMDLEGIAQHIAHHDDLDSFQTTCYFQTSGLKPELLYAMALRPDTTLEMNLDFSAGYRLEDAPLPKVRFEDAGGVKHALEHAVVSWMKVMWRLSDVDLDTGEPFNFLDALCQFTMDRIRTITDFCPLCGTKHEHGGGALKLLACQSPRCQYQFVELCLGCDAEFEILTNPEGVDALISMTYAAATSPRRHDVLIPFPETFVTLQRRKQKSTHVSAAASASASPLDSILQLPLEASGNATAARNYDAVVMILNSIPSVTTMRDQLIRATQKSTSSPPSAASASAAAVASTSTSIHPVSAPITLRSLLSTCHPEAYYLLRWILSTNRSYLREIPLSVVRTEVAPLIIPSTVKQAFQFVSLPPEKERAFQEKAKASRKEMAFHGGGPEVFHSIVRNSLRVLSNTRLMTAGAALGVGIYFGKQFEISAGYSTRSTAMRWPNAAAQTAASPYSMLICEIVVNDKCKDHGNVFVHTDEDSITTRFLLRF